MVCTVGQANESLGMNTTRTLRGRFSFRYVAASIVTIASLCACGGFTEDEAYAIWADHFSGRRIMTSPFASAVAMTGTTWKAARSPTAC